MWSKLMELLKAPEYIEEPRREKPVVIPEQPIQQNLESDGPATLIGYNYLKRKGEDENELPKRFINLNKFLRGGYKDEL